MYGVFSWRGKQCSYFSYFQQDTGTAVLSIFIRLGLDVECKASFRYRGSPFLRKFLPKMLFMTAPY